MSVPINESISINNQTVSGGNFILTTIKFAEEMEESAQKYVKGVREKGKDLENSWQVSKKTISQKQLELAQQSKYMTWATTVLLVTTVAASVGSNVILAGAGGANNATGNLLGSIGQILSNQGNTVATNIGAMYSTPVNAAIGELTDKSQKIWESDKRANESREESLKSLQEKASSATQSATERLGQAFSLRG